MVRKIYENELKDLLELYLHLHESTISEMSEYLSKTWNCVFSTAGHAIDSEQRGQGLEIALPITVGDNVWIGTNVFVLPGVTIGNNTIIGAGSVVNKNIPDGVIAAGNPCKIIRKITDSDNKKYPIFILLYSKNGCGQMLMLKDSGRTLTVIESELTPQYFMSASDNSCS